MFVGNTIEVGITLDEKESEKAKKEGQWSEARKQAMLKGMSTPVKWVPNSLKNCSLSSRQDIWIVDFLTDGT